MNVDRQRHDGAAHVEVVGEGQESDKQLPQLECHVVEQFHCLLFKVPWASLGVENFTDVLNTRSYIMPGIELDYDELFTLSVLQNRNLQIEELLIRGIGESGTKLIKNSKICLNIL